MLPGAAARLLAYENPGTLTLRVISRVYRLLVNTNKQGMNDAACIAKSRSQLLQLEHIRASPRFRELPDNKSPELDRVLSSCHMECIGERIPNPNLTYPELHIFFAGYGSLYTGIIPTIDKTHPTSPTSQSSSPRNTRRPIPPPPPQQENQR